MKSILMKNANLQAPQIIMGCMRINSLEKRQVAELIETALDNGVNFFDHADIYAKGECESIFSDAIQMNATKREKMIIQSKCSIRPGVAFDFSKEHILNSVDGILNRLKTEYLDILLLHRPDTLMEPEQVAEAFNILKQQGKVRHFGVSNQNPGQIELLSKYCDQPIVANQLQLSITNCGMIDAGLNVNMENNLTINRDGGILEYCRLKDITIQAWSPFQYGFFEGVFIGSDKYPELNKKLDELAQKYNVTPSAIAVAWISRHPANMQTIAGTTNKQRFIDICKSSEISLTRDEWYALYMSAGKILP